MRTFTILLAGVVLFLGGCKSKSREKAEQEAIDEMVASEGELKESLKMTEEGLVIDQEALDKHQKATEAAAAKLGGKEGQALQVLADIQSDSNKISKEIEEKSTEFANALDWSTLATEGDYDARRKIMTEYRRFNADVIKVFEGRPAELRKRLDDIDFKGKDRRDLEQGFNSSFGPMMSLIRQIRQCDIEGCDIGIRSIDLLEKEHGKWGWNSTDENVEFDSEDAIDAFNKEMIALEKAGNKQVQLQQQMLGLLR